MCEDTSRDFAHSLAFYTTMAIYLRGVLTNMAGAQSLLRKFEGCLLGALAGDCLGEKFESAERPVPLNLGRLSRFFSSVKHGHVGSEALPYTDDSAMTIVLARSLIAQEKVDAAELARKFTIEYYNNPERGYGLHVCYVFDQVVKLRGDDVLLPAQKQFDGTGSYGNGAAMRVSPVALFYHGNTEKLMEEAIEQSMATHTHPDGYNGAALQAAAVHQALLAGDNSDNVQVVPKLDMFAFLKELKELITPYERNQKLIYVEALDKIETLLKQSPRPSIEEVVKALGNNVTAPKSVPAAIYAFLRAQEPIEGIEAQNLFERTVHYAISLGGDTDTIGSMAGAICGAYVGRANIPDYLVTVCEDYKSVQKLAEQLYQAKK